MAPGRRPATHLLILMILVLGEGPARGVEPIPVGPATTAAPTPSEGAVNRAFDHYVVRGGWITWLVLIPLSVTALAFAVLYGVTISRRGLIPDQTVRKLAALFENGAYGDAVQYASEEPSVLGYVVYSGLIEARNGYAAMERAMEEAIDEQAARLSRKIEYLNIIGNVAPMVGLFGTVHGIIGMFVSIADEGGIAVMESISDDLGTALVATFWGLLIAIPSLTVFGLLRNRIEVLLAEVALTADRMMSVFKPHAVEAPRTQAGGVPPSVPPSATPLSAPGGTSAATGK
jgi:biopolymer transport protein ExbB